VHDKSTEGYTIEKDLSKMASAMNANRAAVATAAGVSENELCEARLENGRLILVPIK
jgi:hypothetical protein